MKAPSTLFGVEQTHGILWRPENRRRAASDGLGWTSLYASAQGETPYESRYAAVTDHLMILHLDGPVEVSRTLGAGRASRRVPPGGMFLLPGGMDFGVRLGGALESLHLYLRHAVLEEVATDLRPGDPARLELVPRLGDHDPLIERIALEIRDALRDPDPSSSALYADYLARALAARLVRAHSAGLVTATPPPRGGLTRAQLEKAIEFIEAHLAAPLSLPQIAAASALSPVHFARRFKQSTGLAPHQHLVLRRIDRAKRLLATSDLAIAEIAFACGFSHQQHLTRAFQRATGTTPAVYRRAALG